MGLVDWFMPKKPTEAEPQSQAGFVPMASGSVTTFTGLDDPALLEYIRTGAVSQTALFNTAVFRCVDLIASGMGALPFRPMRREANGALVEATDHPTYDVLMHQANAHQTAAEFRTWMMLRVLVEGQAFATIARNGERVVGLVPSDLITFRVDQFGQPIYQGPRGVIDPRDVFHLKGLSWKVDEPLSRVRVAARAVGLAKSAEDAAVSMFSTGIDPGGILKHPLRLSVEARKGIQDGLAREHGGASNAGKWLLLDQGMDALPWNAGSARDQQLIERSIHQIEEVARVFGVPRPLIMLGDTSWGSGIEQLAILFVRFALMPSFVMWEQRARMALLTRPERLTIGFDVDERELLRGTLKDQGDFFAKALGGPGAAGWMLPDEVRDLSGLGSLANGAGAGPQWGNGNVASTTS